jgi:hypothetical protein
MPQPSRSASCNEAPIDHRMTAKPPTRLSGLHLGRSVRRHRRPLDIGEEKRQRAGRKIPHGSSLACQDALKRQVIAPRHVGADRASPLRRPKAPGTGSAGDRRSTVQGHTPTLLKSSARPRGNRCTAAVRAVVTGWRSRAEVRRARDGVDGITRRPLFVGRRRASCRFPIGSEHRRSVSMRAPNRRYVTQERGRCRAFWDGTVRSRCLPERSASSCTAQRI